MSGKLQGKRLAIANRAESFYRVLPGTGQKVRVAGSPRKWRLYSSTPTPGTKNGELGRTTWN